MQRDDVARLRAEADRIRAALEDPGLTTVERHELQDGLARIEKRLERVEDRLLKLEESTNQMRGAAALAKVALGLVGFNTIAILVVVIGNAAR